MVTCRKSVRLVLRIASDRSKLEKDPRPVTQGRKKRATWSGGTMLTWTRGGGTGRQISTCLRAPGPLVGLAGHVTGPLKHALDVVVFGRAAGLLLRRTFLSLMLLPTGELLHGNVL